MASTILKPNATKTLTGSVTGAASAHAALSDVSDSSYVQVDTGEQVTVQMDDLSLPGGSVVTRVVGVARTSSYLALTANGYFDLYMNTHYNRSVVAINWGFATNHYVNVYASPTIYDGDVDNAEMYLGVTGNTAFLYTLSLVVFYVAQPTCNITAPAGTVTNNSSPLVTWTNSGDTDGGGFTHFQVQVLDSSSVVVVDSGEVAQADAIQYDFTESLPEGNYTARVRVAQTVNGAALWSAYDTQTFTIDAQVPATPTIQLTPDSSNGRIQIDLADPGGGETTTTWFVVQRSIDGGVTWVTVRSLIQGGLITPVSNAATIYDYEAPNGVTAQYRAYALHWFNPFTSSFTSTSSNYAKDSDSWTSDQWWLKHPTRPDLNWHPVLKSQPGRANEARQGVFQVLGRRAPVVVQDVRQSWTGEVTITCDDDNDREALDAILADGMPVLLQGPADAYWEDTWLATSGLARQRAIDAQWSALTFDTLTWTESDQPTVNYPVEEWP